MNKKIFVIRTMGEKEVKALFPINPKDTTFIDYEKENTFRTGNYHSERELVSTFKGWANPFKKSMFSEDLTYVETYINIGDLTNQIIECIYLDSSLNERVLGTKVITETGFAEFEIDLPLKDMDEDYFYIGFKATSDYEGTCMMLGMVDDSTSNYIDYDKVVSDIYEIFTIDLSEWKISNGGYKKHYIAFKKHIYKELAYKDEIVKVENYHSSNFLDLKFTQSNKGIWWYGGQPTKNDYTGSYHYTNKIDVSDCEYIHLQCFSTYEDAIYIGRYEFMNDEGVVLEANAPASHIGNNKPMSIQVPEGASYVVISLTQSVSDALTRMTISKELLEGYVEYVNINKLKDVYIDETNVLGKKEVVVDLPDKYDLVTDDTFELFYEGIIKAKEPLNYNIEVECSIGKAYRRKFKVESSEEGEYPLTISVYDDYGKLVGSGETKLVVKAPRTSPSENINVLCIGDSLTAGGQWVDELYRRLVKTTSVTQYNASGPQGKGLTNINFVGKNATSNGACYEGYGGWNYRTYLDKENDNPFMYDGVVNFDAYCEELGIDKIDVAYILLGWNSAGEDEETYKANLTEFVGYLMDHNPNCKVIFIGLQMPCLDGLGENYGATGTYSKYRTLQQFVINHNKWNKERADFFGGDFIQLCGQFDSRFNYPSLDVEANSRNQSKVTIGTNGVHPKIEGYYQIADAVYRHFNNNL